MPTWPESIASAGPCWRCRGGGDPVGGRREVEHWTGEAVGHGSRPPTRPLAAAAGIGAEQILDQFARGGERDWLAAHWPNPPVRRSAQHADHRARARQSRRISRRSWRGRATRMRPAAIPSARRRGSPRWPCSTPTSARVPRERQPGNARNSTGRRGWRRARPVRGWRRRSPSSRQGNSRPAPAAGRGAGAMAPAIRTT